MTWQLRAPFTLIKVRIGQGGYRNALLSYWKGCAVTGCLEVSLLRASHIKPWSRANDEERLDPFNGLLLAPHLDVAFDQGLITFGASGELVISPMLSVEDAQRLNLDVRQRLSQIEKRHEYYLAWHLSLQAPAFSSPSAARSPVGADGAPG